MIEDRSWSEDTKELQYLTHQYLQTEHVAMEDVTALFIVFSKNADPASHNTFIIRREYDW